MMKRITYAIISIFILIFQVYAEDPLNIGNIKSLNNTLAQPVLKPVIEAFSTALNTGLFAPVSGTLFSAGIQANLVQIKKEGVLKNADSSLLPVPYVYAGLRIPLVGINQINLFARGMVFPWNSEKTIKLFGFGAGLESKLIPLLSTKIIVQYHMIKDFPSVNVSSLGGTLIASLNLIPFITPYGFFGLNNTEIKTPNINVLGETVDFSMDDINYQFGIGIKLIKMITIEANFTPILSTSIGLGISI